MQHVCIKWFRKNETTLCFCGQLPIVANQSSPNLEKIPWTFDLGAELKQRRYLSDARVNRKWTFCIHVYVNLYHVTKFPFCLSPTVYYFYT